MSVPREQAKTLAELFPGNLGRLQFVRVLMRTRLMQLNKTPWEQPLSADLLAKLHAGIREDEAR